MLSLDLFSCWAASRLAKALSMGLRGRVGSTWRTQGLGLEEEEEEATLASNVM